MLVSTSLAIVEGSRRLAVRVTQTLGRPSSSPFGRARFANAHDIERAGLFAPHGILLGRYRGRDLRLPGQRFALVAAPTRSGKGVSIVVPNLLSYTGSAVVLDIKQENFEVTAGWRAAIGQEVFLFNPFAEDSATHRYNPLDALSRDPHLRCGQILALAQILYPGDGRDRFWSDQARNLFLALTLYVCETPSVPCTMGQVLREVAADAGESPRRRWAERLSHRSAGPNALSADCRHAWARFLANGDATMPGVIAEFNAAMLVFANPIVDAATAASDFSLAEVRRRPMTIYVGVPPAHLGAATRLINLFFAQLVQVNTRALPDPAAGETLQCLVLLDEFAALGRLPAIVDAMPYLAAYQLRLLTVVQSIGQLIALYGEAGARTFVTNHAVQIVFAPRDELEASEVSRALGTGPAWAASWSERLESGGGTWQLRQIARPLLLPQEVRHMGEDALLLMCENVLPIQAQKLRYFRDPSLAARVLPAPPVPRLRLPALNAPSAQRAP